MPTQADAMEVVCGGAWCEALPGGKMPAQADELECAGERA